jgi:hypothetical protein
LFETARCPHKKTGAGLFGLPLAQVDAEEEEEDPRSPQPFGGCGIAMQQSYVFDQGVRIARIFKTLLQ